MKGKLYGVGVGPGDPDLLTIKAVKTIEKCDVIATLPNGEERMAFEAIRKYTQSKKIHLCNLTKVETKQQRIEQHQVVANELEAILEEGKSVAFITLGDATIYSTYIYIHNIVKSHGYETEIVSGIPSFVAAAAALNDSLGIDEEAIHIYPVGFKNEVEDIIQLQGTKVFMKSRKNQHEILSKLQEMEQINTSLVQCCSLPNEKVIHDVKNIKLREIENEYLTTIILKN